MSIKYINKLLNIDEKIEPSFDRKNMYISRMLSITQNIFNYSGLPEEVPSQYLELYLQVSGSCIFTKVNNKYYVFLGGEGGVLDEYYQPTTYIVSNPYLKLSKTFKIGEDCVLVRNDILRDGLMPLMYNYANSMVTNDISLNVADVNSRLITLISADNDNSFKSAEEYLKKIYKGELGIVLDEMFSDGIKTQPLANAGSNNLITQLIELKQYLKASFYNDIGLNSNYNMKRESINGNEADLNNDSLIPYIQHMLECRKRAIKEINKLYGLNISVDLNEPWKQTAEPEEPAEPAEPAEPKEPEEPAEPKEPEEGEK